ncbi:hypothetical protein BD779DRAFT_1492797 [Infundibulicybe gibba]|nr:hypothetical protein BD779DRAFT_1492797 [Infundibulicybe gibba]
MRRETQEDALQMLKDYDTVIILDDSGSMAGRLWREATDALAQMAEYAGQYDVDGIDVYFLNDQRAGHGLRTKESVENLFRDVVPRGVTPIGARLERLLRVYLHDLEAAHATGELARVDAIKAVNYIIITDGAPTDDPESVIVQAARRLDEKHFPTTQVGIQFVQIGSSRSATRFLQELDDALSERHKIRDIVDTTPYLGRLTGDTLVKVLLGGINRRVDRQPVDRR